MIPANVKLSKSGLYSNPATGTDPLPIVYGDLTDGESGTWVLPHIDTVNHVYAFAGHETLSVANGNSIAIYVDGVLASPQPTFDEANNFESQGVISTVTFTSAQDGDVTARGKGKPVVSGGVNLMENPIDIVADILDFAGFDSNNFDKTSKATAAQNATTQGYNAAGVIADNVKTWDIIQDILSTFNSPKTQSFINGEGLLVVNIETGSFTVSAEYTTMPKRHIDFLSAEQRLEDILNSIDGRYRFNYVHDQYYSETPSVTDPMSINLYGILEKTYNFPWCRNVSNILTVLGIILEKFKEPRWFAKITDKTLHRLNLDVGDTVSATLDLLYDTKGNKLINQFWIIQAFNPTDSVISMQLLDTGKYLESTALYNGEYFYDGTITYGGDRDLTEF